MSNTLVDTGVTEMPEVVDPLAPEKCSPAARTSEKSNEDAVVRQLVASGLTSVPEQLQEVQAFTARLAQGLDCEVRR